VRRSILFILVVLLAAVPGARGQNREGPGSLVERFDANGDGKLCPEELPERMRRRFGRLDADGDGFVTA
jgi:hypothetical protein